VLSPFEELTRQVRRQARGRLTQSEVDGLIREIEADVEGRTVDLARQGVSTAEAERQVVARFGDTRRMVRELVAVRRSTERLRPVAWAAGLYMASTLILFTGSTTANLARLLLSALGVSTVAFLVASFRSRRPQPGVIGALSLAWIPFALTIVGARWVNTAGPDAFSAMPKDSYTQVSKGLKNREARMAEEISMLRMGVEGLGSGPMRGVAPAELRDVDGIIYPVAVSTIDGQDPFVIGYAKTPNLSEAQAHWKEAKKRRFVAIQTYRLKELKEKEARLAAAAYRPLTDWTQSILFRMVLFISVVQWLILAALNALSVWIGNMARRTKTPAFC